MTPTSAYRTLAVRIDPERHTELSQRLAVEAERWAPEQWEGQHQAALLLATAYPAYARRVMAGPASVIPPLPIRLEQLHEECTALLDHDDFMAQLRRHAERHRMRIALRELLSPSLGGADIEETAREISELAEAHIACALVEAKRAVFARLGVPRHPDGRESQLSVLGMGKLGGEELNAGSDVDLVCFYDSDGCEAEGKHGPVSAHQIWTKVVQRLATTLEEPTADGIVWRVDLRLRPEGSRGPLVNSLVAAERYYEDYGRLWERAAMSRARPVAGCPELGEQVMAMLAPFIWRRSVDPTIATGIYKMAHRARDELSREAERDLKLGVGGIRAAEMFVQTLQLIWGGREPRIRCRPTIAAVDRLRGAGFVSEREARELAAAYVALRRCEHAVQFASGVQTHLLPADEADLARLARALGFDDAAALQADLQQHRDHVAALFASLLPGKPVESRWLDALYALDRADADGFGDALRAAGMRHSTQQHHGQLVHDLFEVARMPDSLLGARTRERHTHLAEALLDALADAADPTQAARFLRSLSMRARQGAIYARLLSDDPAALQRLVTLLGGSAYVAATVASKPELLDLILFDDVPITPGGARDEVLQGLELTASGRRDHEATDRVIGHLRTAKARVITQVALSDLAGEIDTRRAQRILARLADAQLEAAARHALGCDSEGVVKGMCLIAMGSLGSSETGYGSDLDVMFVFDGDAEVPDPVAHFSRAARRIIQTVSLPHPAGRGYELDARLRPSGNQGLLVVSLGAFARYHGLATASAGPMSSRQAAPWERIALVRARWAAGDPDLGARAMELIERATYERAIDGAAVTREIDRVRVRMQQELSRERASAGRHDLKLGRGGLLEAQLTVQLLQLLCRHPSVHVSGTRAAIEALGDQGMLDNAEQLRSAYDFLSSLEQRLRVLHADDTCLIEENAAGLVPLARRMGLRDTPGETAAQQLMERYHMAADAIHHTYRRVMQQSDTGGD